jgi:hypothetical protein
VDYGSIPDWIAAVAAVVTAAVAIKLGFQTFQHQRTTADVQLALSLFERINVYWDRLTDSKSANYQYDMGQILAQFELAAMLFNTKTLSGGALPILKDHIVEVFTALQLSDEGQKIIGLCKSSPDTFSELTKFSRQHMPTALRVLGYSEKP